MWQVSFENGMLCRLASTIAAKTVPGTSLNCEGLVRIATSLTDGSGPGSVTV